MKDFTLNCYRQYLRAIKSSYANILRFDYFFSLKTKPDSFVLIRHDVDRNPKKALQMALIESEMGIRSSYYFRSKKHTFKPDIIKKISELGHEIGYHYESLSDQNGDMKLALLDFKKNLDRFRNIVPIYTIAMHGRPFKPFDNRDMWRDPINYSMLSDQLNIFGEVYLDIDYTEIAYINDTGRNWNSIKANKRDKVNSNINANFNDKTDLMCFFNEYKCSKIIFQVHPERWAKNETEYFLLLIKDSMINLLKLLIR